MNILNIDCKDIINLLQVTLHLQHVNVIYDSMETIRIRLEGGEHTIFLNVINDEAEREKYEKKAEVAQDKYKTKSPAIHFPDLKVWQLIEVFKADVTGAYERTCHYLDSVMMKAECPIELKLVMNTFLHEVGHWNQLIGMNRHVKQYIEMDLDLEKKNADDSFELHKKIHGIRDMQGTDRPHIPKGVMSKLIELEEEYRQIPKEADADRYAREILSELDIEAFVKNLGIVMGEQTPETLAGAKEKVQGMIVGKDDEERLIHSLFIIGNGFDLEHDYPTAYRHFREYLITRFPDSDKYDGIVPSSIQMPDGDEQYDIDEVAGFITRILDECAGDEWSNLESFLGHDAIRSLMGDLFEVNLEQSDKDLRHAVYNNEDLSTAMNQTFRKVIDFFREWINDYYGNFKYGFNKLVKDRSIDYKDNIACVLEEADAFLSFNYTETLEKVYGVEAEKVCHIHGKVGDAPERLFVGHGEDEEVEESLQTMGADSNLNELMRILKKDTEDAFDRNIEFFDKIGGGLESIHTFGFSFSDVDLYYIQKIAERTDPSKVTWYINKYDEEKRKAGQGNDNFKKQIDKVAAIGFNIEVDNRW